MACIPELSLPNRFCVFTSCLVLFPHKSPKNRSKLCHLFLETMPGKIPHPLVWDLVIPAAQLNPSKPGENDWIRWVLGRSRLRALFSLGLLCRVGLFTAIKEGPVCYRPQTAWHLSWKEVYGFGQVSHCPPFLSPPPLFSTRSGG